MSEFIIIITSQFSQKLLSFNQFNKKSVKLIKQSKLCDATLTNVKICKSTSNLMNIAIIKTAIYKMLIKWSDMKTFAVIVLKIDQLITTVENKLEEVNLHELSHVKTLEEIKVKLFFKYHDYLNMFNWVMIDQLSFHHFYDHKIKLINEEIFLWSKLYQMFNHKL